MDILEQLKQETAEQHEAVEQVVPLTRADLTVEEYGDYLVALYPFYEALEHRFARLPGLTEVVQDMPLRWKTPLLEADLQGLHRDLPTPAGIPSSLIVDSVPQALGVLYVLEGSTLGGQILVRIVRGRLGATIGDNTRFLKSYGEGVGSMWRAMCASIRRGLPGAGEQDSAVRAAQSTFQAFQQLIPTPVRSL